MTADRPADPETPEGSATQTSGRGSVEPDGALPDRLPGAPALTFDPSTIRWGPDGLVPAIAQDRADGRVLMLAWQDAEALEATLRTGEAHFHSRSRGQLWRKGETSGNVLRVVEISLDCDNDAIVLTVDPIGPTCHTGARSCFDVGAHVALGDEAAEDASIPPGSGSVSAPVTTAPTVSGNQGFDWLEELWRTIQSRASASPDESYTARLLAAGVDLPARKVAEEAIEVLMAAKDDAITGDATSRGALRYELADLVYHLLVVCAERDLPPSAVIEELKGRHRTG